MAFSFPLKTCAKLEPSFSASPRPRVGCWIGHVASMAQTGTHKGPWCQGAGPEISILKMNVAILIRKSGIHYGYYVFWQKNGLIMTALGPS